MLAGNEVVPIANGVARDGDFDLVVATIDWHPPDHASFAANHPGKKPGDVIGPAARDKCSGLSIASREAMAPGSYPVSTPPASRASSTKA